MRPGVRWNKFYILYIKTHYTYPKICKVSLIQIVIIESI